MKNLFFDTNALLNANGKVFDPDVKVFVSDITLKELESIKTSGIKDPETKYQARRVVHSFEEHEKDYTMVLYQRDWDSYFDKFQVLLNNNDSRIIIAALATKEDVPDLIFITQDLVCKKIAEACGLKVEYTAKVEEEYSGFSILYGKTADEIAGIYQTLWAPNMKDILEPKLNQYFILKDETEKLIDAYKYTERGMVQIEFRSFDSKHLGKIKPMDKYQMCLMDSIATNQLTICGGPAGTGKSLLSMGYLLQELEKGKIDRIIIFCNTVATMGSAKLGYYPGSRTEKLLDSQIGNFLVSKIGGREEVERMIDIGQLILLPMSDIRGFDTSDMHAGVYITEAQNLDINLMKLALQRIGKDSICILDGDYDTQVDLSMYAGNSNGLRRVSEVFRGQDFFGQVNLVNIYRSKIANIAEQM